MPGFHHLYEGGRIQEAACLVHVRRNFYDLQVARASPLAAEALMCIGGLYAIESNIRGRPPEERLHARIIRARPLLDSLHQGLEATLAIMSKKSEIAAAIRYALGRWRALRRYCEDGQIKIANNAAERALRAVALGRKNYLFAGSDPGGERDAAIYGLVGTAKLNGLDPEVCLREVLQAHRRPSRQPHRRAVALERRPSSRSYCPLAPGSHHFSQVSIYFLVDT